MKVNQRENITLSEHNLNCIKNYASELPIELSEVKEIIEILLRVNDTNKDLLAANKIYSKRLTTQQNRLSPDTQPINSKDKCTQTDHILINSQNNITESNSKNQFELNSNCDNGETSKENILNDSGDTTISLSPILKDKVSKLNYGLDNSSLPNHPTYSEVIHKDNSTVKRYIFTVIVFSLVFNFYLKS